MSKNISFLILAVTALALSRGMFYLFSDPEGPNLVVVAGMALILFAASIAGNYFHSSTIAVLGTRRLVIAVVVQIIVVTGFYVWFR
jgi:hypothetical protein